MPFSRAYYFIRVNGETAHNDPHKTQCYVRGEPPEWPKRFFTYIDYCLNEGIIRIGWLATGDLRALSDIPQSSKCYNPLKNRIRNYLREFGGIEVGSVILMPDKERPGTLYAGETTSGYSYFHDPPKDPFECAHRLKVTWDRQVGHFAEYDAHAFGIRIRGGFWTLAFHRIDRSQSSSVIETIEQARRRRDK